MKENRNSTLSQHRLKKKQGVVVTPFNDSLGSMLKLKSWTKERLPEYLWLGLILNYYGRNSGLQKAMKILNEIGKAIPIISSHKMSIILKLDNDTQKILFDIIKRHVDVDVMAPLTVLYDSCEYPIFNAFFYVYNQTVDERIGKLSETIKKYYNPSSHDTADLRFLAIAYFVLTKKLSVVPGALVTVDAIRKYAYTEHEDEEMGLYRSSIRSLEGIMFEEDDIKFITAFWESIGLITSCNPVMLKFEVNKRDYKALITDCQRAIKYVLFKNKQKSLSDDKFDVVLGIVNYSLKIFNEIETNNLGNSALGRHGVRTIIESLINVKYLLKIESEHQNVWEEFQLYGLSKYKLVLLKAREKSENKESHFMAAVAEVLVNEKKWEEFLDVDLKYFDKLGIREKSIEVGEKELYDLYYDYDSSYSHGLWGAIRESSMLNCDKSEHRYHSVPDLTLKQNLPDVKYDSCEVIKRLFLLLSSIYELPQWFNDKYQKNNGKTND